MTTHPAFTRDDEEPRRVRAFLIAVLLGLVTAFCFEAVDGVMRAEEIAEGRTYQAQIQQWRDGISRAVLFRLLAGDAACGEPGHPAGESEAAEAEPFD